MTRGWADLYYLPENEAAEIATVFDRKEAPLTRLGATLNLGLDVAQIFAPDFGVLKGLTKVELKVIERSLIRKGLNAHEARQVAEAVSREVVGGTRLKKRSAELIAENMHEMGWGLNREGRVVRTGTGVHDIPNVARPKASTKTVVPKKGEVVPHPRVATAVEIVRQAVKKRAPALPARVGRAAVTMPPSRNPPSSPTAKQGSKPIVDPKAPLVRRGPQDQALVRKVGGAAVGGSTSLTTRPVTNTVPSVSGPVEEPTALPTRTQPTAAGGPPRSALPARDRGGEEPAQRSSDVNAEVTPSRLKVPNSTGRDGARIEPPTSRREATIYVAPEDGRRLIAALRSPTGDPLRITVLANDRLALQVANGPRVGTIVPGSVIKLSRTPVVGLAPLVLRPRRKLSLGSAVAQLEGNALPEPSDVNLAVPETHPTMGIARTVTRPLVPAESPLPEASGTVKNAQAAPRGAPQTVSVREPGASDRDDRVTPLREWTWKGGRKPKTLEDAAKFIQHLENEQIIVILPSGEVWTRVGVPDKVNILLSDIKRCKGASTIHNHPNNNLPGPDDLKSAALFAGPRAGVKCKNGTLYIITVGPNGWPDPEVIKKEVIKSAGTAFKELQRNAWITGHVPTDYDIMMQSKLELRKVLARHGLRMEETK